METMTLTIHVPKNVGIILEEKAKVDGKDLAEYVEEIVTKQAGTPTFRELFADVRRNIALSDEDLEKEIDAAIDESRRAKLKK
jgi:predicted Zn-dependent peptidase